MKQALYFVSICIAAVYAVTPMEAKDTGFQHPSAVKRGHDGDVLTKAEIKRKLEKSRSEHKKLLREAWRRITRSPKR